MKPIRAWLMAARPATLSAAVVPVLVGTALAFRDVPLNAVAFAAALAGAMGLQIGTNLANDYFDWKSGADNAGRLGPVRVTQSGLIPPRKVIAAAWICFGMATICGVVLIAIAGWPIAVLGLLAIAAGVLYTGGPFPYGYRGLGDAICFLFFGVAAVGVSYFVQTGTVTLPVLAASVPVGLTVTAILVVNNIRDIDTDRAAGKRTLAVILGRRASRIQYGAFLIGALAAPPLFGAAGLLPAHGALTLFSIPLVPGLLRAVATRVDGPSLNAALRGTARFHLVFGAMFAIGILLGDVG
ncbi:MAG: 1,4-dihydroxy-2-naphthoate polyprenyltransferase [Myxococcota bacterium]